MNLAGSIVGGALAPLRAASRALDDLATLARTAERFDPRTAALLAVGERLICQGEQIDERFAALDVHMRTLDGHFERFDAHLRRLLALADELERELPQMREAAAAVSDLRDSAEPVAAAAERAERVAQRIPGLRG